MERAPSPTRIIENHEVAVMPTQMLGQQRWRPEHYLFAAILDEAKQDLIREDLKQKADALAWVMDPEDWEGASFINTCHILKLDPEAVRHELLIAANGPRRSRNLKLLHSHTGKWDRSIL